MRMGLYRLLINESIMFRRISSIVFGLLFVVTGFAANEINIAKKMQFISILSNLKSAKMYQHDLKNKFDNRDLTSDNYAVF